MAQEPEYPLITIGLTCYNAEDSIERAVKSACAQTWPNLEILVVDDVSSDKSVAIIETLVTKHKNLKLIKHSVNTGPAGARQTLLDNANGEFIAFFDDDDESLPERCEKQYERITSYEQESGTDLIACYASGKRLYPNGYELRLNAVGSKPDIPKGTDMADYLLFFKKKKTVFYGGGTPSCALMARTSTFKQVGGFDPTFRRVEDLDFAVRLSLKKGHFIGCPETLFIQYSTQAGDKSPAKNLESEIQLAEKHKDYLRSVGRYEYARRWPLVRYHHFKGEHLKMLHTLFILFLKAPVKTTTHFVESAPKRFLHEMKMKKERS